MVSGVQKPILLHPRSVQKSSHAKKQFPTNNIGFTLLELLVVIGVISVLAALLYPVLSSGKDQAECTRCKSNVRQLDIQLVMYVNDFSVYPSSQYAASNIVGTIVPLNLGQNEAKEPEEQGVRRCPTRMYMQYGAAGGMISFNRSTSYGYNGVGYVGTEGLGLDGGLGLGGGFANGRRVREPEVRVPSGMMALGDNLALLPKSGSDLPSDTVMESNDGLDRQEPSGARGLGILDAVKRAAARHRRRANIAFCDGHVVTLSFKRLFLDLDDASLRRWNRDHDPHR